jgi:hypothetical protein
MQATIDGGETALEKVPRQTESAGSLSPVEASRALVSEPFPAVEAGSVVLRELELVRLVDQRHYGKYRVQQRGRGEDGLVFLVTLFGATCSKVEMLGTRRLGWRDYVAAMKRAIEREIGYGQNRLAPISGNGAGTVEVVVRDTDFAIR